MFNLKKLYKQITKPPGIATDNSKQAYIKKVASEWREILLIDVIIIAFLIASIHQIAYFFEEGEPTKFTWLKAFGFDLAIVVFSRHVSRAKVLNEKAKGVWVVLIFLMLITIICNVGYEWLQIKGEWGDGFIVTDTLKNFKAIITSGSLAVIILGISVVRANIMKSFEERQRKYKKLSTDIDTKRKRAEYARNYRARKMADGGVVLPKKVLVGQTNYRRGKQL